MWRAAPRTLAEMGLRGLVGLGYGELVYETLKSNPLNQYEDIVLENFRQMSAEQQAAALGFPLGDYSLTGRGSLEAEISGAGQGFELRWDTATSDASFVMRDFINGTGALFEDGEKTADILLGYNLEQYDYGNIKYVENSDGDWFSIEEGGAYGIAIDWYDGEKYYEMPIDSGSSYYWNQWGDWFATDAFWDYDLDYSWITDDLEQMTDTYVGQDISDLMFYREDYINDLESITGQSVDRSTPINEDTFNGTGGWQAEKAFKADEIYNELMWRMDDYLVMIMTYSEFMSEAQFAQAWSTYELMDIEYWNLMFMGIGAFDPLVIDLDGDGVETISVLDSTVLFAFGEDDATPASGWVGTDDGLLALDADHNGTIDDGGELFGNNSENGFAVLARFDTDGDGRITASDERFDELMVWKDRNSNGISESGELFGLQALNITWLDLEYENVNEINNRNIIDKKAVYGTSDGRTGELADVWFRITDEFSSIIQTGSAMADCLQGGVAGDTLSGGQGDDFLLGGAGEDLLAGEEGADILYGGIGNDRLIGGAGADSYRFYRSGGLDVVDNRDQGMDGDEVVFDGDLTSNCLWFERTADDLKVSIIGTGDAVTVTGWYLASANHVARFEVAGSILADADVENLVSAMAAFSPPPVGQTTLSVDQHQQMDTVIAANWKAA